jgi:hypothetical protein
MPLDGADPLPAPEAGCLYLLDDRQPCGCAQQLGSPYCKLHHALCHVIPGSRAEQSYIDEIEIAAAFVGRRVVKGITPECPPQRFMRALDKRQRRR